MKTGKLRSHREVESLTRVNLESALAVVRRYLLLSLKHPVPSDDTVVNRLFALPMLVATGSRPGDVVWITEEESPDRALQFQDLDLRLSPLESSSFQ